MARFLIPEETGSYSYGADALDGDVENIAFEEPVPFALQLFPPRMGFGGGSRISGENMPTKLRMQGRKRKIPDFSNEYHMLMVNQRFLDVIAGFQKDIQTFPVECFWKDGSSAGSFFFFFTTVLLDAVIREKTTAKWSPNPRGGFWHPQPGQTFTFDRERMGDTHIWVDPHMPTKWPLVSDALFAALKQADIRNFHNSVIHEEV